MANSIHLEGLRAALAAYFGTGLKAMLVNGYVDDKTHTFVASAAPSEIATTGYVGGFGGAGRKALTTVAWSRDDVNGRVKLTADNPTWAAAFGVLAGVPISGIVIYKPVTNDADSPIVCHLAWAAVANSGSMTAAFDAIGLCKVDC